jgi:hypothetical protein
MGGDDRKYYCQLFKVYCCVRKCFSDSQDSLTKISLIFSWLSRDTSVIVSRSMYITTPIALHPTFLKQQHVILPFYSTPHNLCRWWKTFVSNIVVEWVQLLVGFREALASILGLQVDYPQIHHNNQQLRHEDAGTVLTTRTRPLLPNLPQFIVHKGKDVPVL